MSFNRQQSPPIPSLTSNDTIFVSIASYRDCECINTLTDVFFRAAFPHRVFVGVCQQNHPVEDRDIDVINSPVYRRFNQQIRLITMPANDAKGPMFARALIEQQLFQNETFYLQIDSHCMLVQNWDEILVKELMQCDSERPVLTTYPHDFDRKTRRAPPGLMPTYLRFREFHGRLGFTEQERRNFAFKPERPQPSLFWAAGFSFTLGEAIKQVPYDPYCPYVFVGEEMSMALRFFTHGWDLFAPTQNVVFHLLKRTYRPTFWEQVYKKKCVVDEATRMERKAEEQRGVERIRALVNGATLDEPYGLGHERSLKDWEKFVGVDIRRAKGSRRSFMGLTPNASEEERRSKFTRDVYEETFI